MWRLVLERVATLEEIERHWSIMDVVHMGDALDAVRGAEDEARERARESAKERRS